MAYQFTMNSMEAEDLTQDIFIKLYSSLNKYAPGSNFKLWVYRIAKNHIIDWYRKNKYISLRMEEFKKNIESENSGETLRDNLEDLKIKLRKVINSLEPDFRLPIVLRDLQGLSYEEISKILDIPVGTVKSRINRARLYISEILRGDS